MEDQEVHVVTAERRRPTERSKRCSTSDQYGDNDALRQHCELLTDAYTRSFVIGMSLHRQRLTSAESERTSTASKDVHSSVYEY